MTELKCPIHDMPLEECIGYDGDYCCRECGSNVMYGSEELWQALIDTKNQLTVERTTHDILQEELKKLQKELADTKKKLDIAVDALFDIHKHSYACCNPASEIGYVHAVSYNALDKTGNGLE